MGAVYGLGNRVHGNQRMRMPNAPRFGSLGRVSEKPEVLAHCRCPVWRQRWRVAYKSGQSRTDSTSRRSTQIVHATAPRRSSSRCAVRQRQGYTCHTRRIFASRSSSRRRPTRIAAAAPSARCMPPARDTPADRATALGDGGGTRGYSVSAEVCGACAQVKERARPLLGRTRSDLQQW
ncbi:hypothetical protein FA95DRAFT_1011755 [Auriscalpium vulgare]|uniref:Uncharacterized protein n=1 Tax=Auriscalpium vulgare TaxID=40419 RepID=A0ACB8RY07_9AGAM|nr:hypothetical protein FA95DRAFT_1011755 [Auriscalpium vulgare]